jgi:hypothetical protein
MRKLARVANIVVKVGKSCEKYNLNEQDLPDGLRDILGSLQRFVHFIAVLPYDYNSLTNDQRVGWGWICTEEVRGGESRQRIPSPKGSSHEDQAMRWRAI